MVIHFPVSKYKHFELQFNYWTGWSQWFYFELSLSRNIDHAGFQFNFEIIGLYFHIWIYDTRHIAEQ